MDSHQSLPEYLALVTGYGFIAIVLVAMAISPRSWWAQELARRYGVRPSGPFGIFTHRDLLRRAMLSFLAFALLLGLALALSTQLERWPGQSQLGLLVSTYFFAAFLLAGIGFLAALEALWRAIFWRPQLPPAPLDPTEWHFVADFLARAATSVPTDPEWVTFTSRTLHDPTIRQVRSASLRLCGGRPQRFSGPLQSVAVAWATTLRASI